MASNIQQNMKDLGLCNLDAHVVSKLKKKIDHYNKNNNVVDDSAALYYSYFDIKDLHDALLSTTCIQKYDIIPGIINIICEYNGITNWSNIDKSDNISIISSKDNKISYAIAKRIHDEEQWIGDTILFNQWINLDCNKSIYNYIFRVTQYNSIDNTDKIQAYALNIGIISSKYSLNNLTDIMEDKTTLGMEKSGHSICWYYSGYGSRFYHKIKSSSDTTLQWNRYFVKNGFKNDENSYFMMEINFKTNQMKVTCLALDKVPSTDKTVIYDIPKEFIKQIETDEMFRVGMTLTSRHGGVYGVGLVRSN